MKLLEAPEIVEAFRQSGNRPEWMISLGFRLFPPDLRPMVIRRRQDLIWNDLYRRHQRNNRLKRMLEPMR